MEKFMVVLGNKGHLDYQAHKQFVDVEAINAESALTAALEKMKEQGKSEYRHHHRTLKRG